MTEQALNQEIFNRYGAVTRARGYFFYTKKNVRLVDMYQADGRAILGWGGGAAFTRLKNILNRGVTGFFPTEYELQIHKAASSLLKGDFFVLFYADLKNASAACDFFSEDGELCRYLPWNPEKTDYSQKKAVLILPPLPWTDSIFMVAVQKSLFDSKSSSLESGEFLQDTLKVPSPVIAAIARSIYDLIKVVGEREEKDWFIYDKILTRFWIRKGPYLFPKIAENVYDDFVKKCLDLGLVISPVFGRPSIVPFGADKGVFTKLKDLDIKKYAAD